MFLPLEKLATEDLECRIVLSKLLTASDTSTCT